MNTSAGRGASDPGAQPEQQGDGRSLRWNRHREQRRVELLRLSVQAVGELGPGASMAEIAGACRTSKSVFYRYFQDKEGLQRELASFVVERMGRRMRAAAAEAPSFEASVRALVEQYLWQIQSAPHVYRFITRGSDAHAEGPVGRFALATAELLIEEHRRRAPAHRRLEPRMAGYWAAGVVGMVRGAGEAWMSPEPAPRASAPRPGLDEFVEIVTAWVVAGTSPPGADAAAQPPRASAPSTRARRRAPPEHGDPIASHDPLTAAGPSGHELPQEDSMTTTAQKPRTGRDDDRRREGEHAFDPAADSAVVDHDVLREAIAGRWAEQRRAARRLAADPRLHIEPGTHWSEHREATFDHLALLAGSDAVRAGLPVEQGGAGDPAAYLSGFEEFVLADPSLQIKAGVQWGLFGSAIVNLGTQKHHERWLEDIWSLRIPGAFAMTETGHGSDVASIATTATYDPATEEFEIHTPHRGAWKDYLGNAALNGRAAVVFAQLITDGVDHGVHAFFVPLRDDSGQFLPGVGGEDDGHKGGLNGVDNGRLHFDRVRVPRENLLDRYGHVAADGTYTSPIESPGRRFFTMLGTLVQGRVSLDGASVVAARAGLSIALTYASQRRQFAPVKGRAESVLLDYHQHQRRLFPYVAKVLASGFAHEELLEAFDGVFSGRSDTDESRQDLETMAAALKASSTRLALDALQECREACGGAGFLSENRIPLLRADLDVYATFEGDNTVLMQLVAKRLLGDFAKGLSGLPPAGKARWAAGRAAEATFSRSGLRGLSQVLRDTGDPRRSVNFLRDPETQHALLSDRVSTMVEEAAENMRGADRSDPEAAAQAFDRNQHRLIEAARAHAELLKWEAFTRALDEIDDDGTRQVMIWLRDLFGLTVIDENLGWYLAHGRLSLMRGRMIDAYLQRLVGRLRPHIMDVVAAFDFPQELLRAKIATGAEAQRQEDAAAWRAARDAAGRTAAPEGSSDDGSDAAHPGSDEHTPAQADPTLDKPMDRMS